MGVAMNEIEGSFLFIEMGYTGGFPEGGTVLFHCDSQSGLSKLCAFFEICLQKGIGEETVLEIDPVMSAQIESWSPYPAERWGMARELAVVLVKEKSHGSVEMFPGPKRVEILSERSGIQYLLERCRTLDDVWSDKEVIFGSDVPLSLGNKNSEGGIVAQVLVICASQNTKKKYTFGEIFL